MRSHLLIFLIASFFTYRSWAQASVEVGGINELPQTTDTTNPKSLDKQASVDVLFATNEDCNLSIYGEFEGLLSRSQHKRLKLPVGRYTYKAVSRVAGGELEETFQVKESGLNEIFIDLLYASDQKNVSGSGRTNSGVTVNTSPNRSVPKEVEMKNAKETERFVIGSLLANMSTVDGGSFIMGNNRAPSGDEAEHTVTIKPILFGIYEVTQKQWETIMGYNPSDNKGCGTCPVENVSWEEAMKFIQKINSLSDKRFRLPTEAEWEYVAKYGGKAEVDQYGGQEEFIKATGWYYANSDKKTHPVGQKAPNASGIYDLIGNVSEWCYDWYSPDYFKEQSSQKNPEGPPLGKEKVVRGTSYNDYLGDRFRPSLRNKLKPVTKSKEIGFRLVLDRY